MIVSVKLFTACRNILIKQALFNVIIFRDFEAVEIHVHFAPLQDTYTYEVSVSRT